MKELFSALWLLCCHKVEEHLEIQYFFLHHLFFTHLMEQSLPSSSGVSFPCDVVSCSEIDGAPLQVHFPCPELCRCSDRA